MSDHDYLSTACFHGLHAPCRKQCKFCDAQCRCSCHVVQAIRDLNKKQRDTPEQLSHSEVEGAKQPRRSQTRKDRT